MVIAALILAAGGSSRLGKPKQFITLRGQTLIRRIVRVAEQAGCEPILVVAGSAAAQVENELASGPARVILNPHWEEGIGSSIRVGVNELLAHFETVDALFLLPCDLPFLNEVQLLALRARQLATGKPIVASAYAGTLGIPALFLRSHFYQLSALFGDHGGKELLLRQPDRVSVCAFPGGEFDLDTPADCDWLRQLQAGAAFADLPSPPAPS